VEGEQVTPDGFKEGPVFVDKYLDGEAYVFIIERDGERGTCGCQPPISSDPRRDAVRRCAHSNGAWSTKGTG
jgi:hypothetical protein